MILSLPRDSLTVYDIVHEHLQLDPQQQPLLCVSFDRAGGVTGAKYACTMGFGNLSCNLLMSVLPLINIISVPESQSNTQHLQYRRLLGPTEVGGVIGAKYACTIKFCRCVCCNKFFLPACCSNFSGSRYTNLKPSYASPCYQLTII